MATKQDIIETIKARAHNDTLRSLIAGDVTATLTYDEADALGDEASAWLRSKGLQLVDDSGFGVAIRAAK